MICPVSETRADGQTRARTATGRPRHSRPAIGERRQAGVHHTGTRVRAWGEARCWAEAIEWLDKALAAEAGVCPLRAIEQRANYRVRRAADEWLARRRAAPGPEPGRHGSPRHKPSQRAMMLRWISEVPE